MRGFTRQLSAALRAFLLLSVLLGLVYPLVVTGVAQVALRGPADGSLIERDGRVVGSSLIGQAFTDPRNFQPRPSASHYAGDSSGSGNLSPVAADQLAEVRERANQLRSANRLAPAEIPADALTASSSGLDPDISIDYARWQAPRVAAARGLQVAAVQTMIAQQTTGRTLGFLGQPRVNVLELNLALDQQR
ncbi:MAG: potassium-transporting ATPase subunit KdpC [Dermatophilaceae bacterium]